MFCGNCGKEINEKTKFCPYCGQAVQSAANNMNYTENHIGHQKSSSGKWIVLTIAIIAVVIIGFFTLGNPEDEILQFRLNVVNHTGVDIYSLYASEVDVDNWEEDMLGSEILYDGESVNIRFTITEEDMDWDFAMEDIWGNMVEFYGLSFENCDPDGATLVLEYDGVDGTATLY